MPSRPEKLAASILTLRATAGYTEYCQGDLQAAANLLRQELQRDEFSGPAWELLGLALRDLGQPFEAADALERASLLHCVQPLTRICLAECYAVLKRHELACELYLLQAEELADDADFLLLVASGLAGIDRPHLAVDICRRAAFVEPASGQVQYDMCFYSMRCGCSASLAKSLAWRAVELEPENIHFRIGLSSLLLRLGELERAAWVVGRIDEDQFAQLSCRCCLERIAELYREVGNHELHQVCAKRMAAIEFSDSGASFNSELR